ncbi:2OG-Fe(II) oxygenase [Sphingomonas sp. LT1P40]|uniref:2OG-Fe(II) oxygenase n=1 Tax=Alteristakelama amylovorans TaxID=3096166 RepID=UPI002FC63DDC
MNAGFALHPSIDPARLATAFARDGRVQIAPFLTDAHAERLAAHLAARADWRRVLNSSDKVFEFAAAELAALTPDQRTRLDDAVHSAARAGFQYRYDSIRVPDAAAARAAQGDPLAALAAFLSSPPVLAMLASITGDTGPTFADAQATRYLSGDFLTAHDDAVPGKNRHAAYVLGLTPQWRAEWGGLLLFHGGAGGIAEGYVPGFNTLSLFAVPQAHSVSLVAPYAAHPRLSVTGWLRSGQP